MVPLETAAGETACSHHYAMGGRSKHRTGAGTGPVFDGLSVTTTPPSSICPFGVTTDYLLTHCEKSGSENHGIAELQGQRGKPSQLPDEEPEEPGKSSKTWSLPGDL